MEECCPDAWMLNLTNPMTVLCRTVARETNVKVVGLCHEVTNMLGMLSLFLGRNLFAARVEVTGVNHVPVITRATLDGEDLWPEIEDLAWGRIDLDRELPVRIELDSSRPGSFGMEKEHPNTYRWLWEHNHVNWELFKRFGALVAPGSRHVAEAFPMFLAAENDHGRQWGIHHTSIDEREDAEANYQAELDRRLASDKVTRHRSMEMVAPVIDALVGGPPATLPLNIPNHGQCPDLPADVVVESICEVDASGIVDSQELTLQAALTGDRNTLLAAMMTDPHAGTLGYESLMAMTDELLAASQTWLPQFG
jgi:alpha-galactosidase